MLVQTLKTHMQVLDGFKVLKSCRHIPEKLNRVRPWSIYLNFNQRYFNTFNEKVHD